MFPKDPDNGRRSVLIELDPRFKRDIEREVQIDLADLSEFFESETARRRATEKGKLPPKAEYEVKRLINQAVELEAIFW